MLGIVFQTYFDILLNEVRMYHPIITARKKV